MDDEAIDSSNSSARGERLIENPLNDNHGLQIFLSSIYLKKCMLLTMVIMTVIMLILDFIAIVCSLVIHSDD